MKVWFNTETSNLEKIKNSKTLLLNYNTIYRAFHLSELEAFKDASNLVSHDNMSIVCIDITTNCSSFIDLLKALNNILSMQFKCEIEYKFVESISLIHAKAEDI